MSMLPLLLGRASPPPTYELVASSSGTATVTVTPAGATFELAASSSGSATVTVAAGLIWELVSGTDAGYALRFYGSNTADVDRVRIPLTSGGGTVATGANVGASDFTYELWVKCQSANNTSSSPTDWRFSNVLFDRDIWNDSRGHGIGVTNDGGNLVVVFGVAGGSLDHVTLSGTSNVGDNAWHFIVVDRNASTGLIRLGVDGTWQDSGTYTTGTLAYPTSYTPTGGQDNEFIVLGQEKHDVASDDGYNGVIGYVRLSTARRYTGGSFSVPTVIPEDDASTGALYLFRDGAGTTLSDYAAGNTDGTLLVGGSNNGPTWQASDLTWINQNATITTAAATTVYELVASSSGSATVTVTLAAVVYELSASSSGTATVTVVGASAYELVASSSGSATVTVTIAALIYELAAFSSGTATVTVAQALTYELAASSSGSATVTVTIATLVYELSASSTGSATVTVTASGDTTYEISASSTGDATVTVTLAAVVYELAASSSGQAVVSVVSSESYELAASSSGSATVTITLAAIIYELVADSTGTATVTITLAGQYEIEASSTGDATVTVTIAALIYEMVAASTGTATITVSAEAALDMAASSTGDAVVDVTIAAMLYALVASSTGSASVTVSLPDTSGGGDVTPPVPSRGRQIGSRAGVRVGARGRGVVIGSR